jgi:hypothetical protein
MYIVFHERLENARIELFAIRGVFRFYGFTHTFTRKIELTPICIHFSAIWPIFQCGWLLVARLLD